ncbi:hypothetical protein VTO73DRAFT_11957 [Trametes versicolor]
MGETRVRTTGRKSTWTKRVSAGASKVVVPLPIVTGHCTHRENLSGFPMSASSPTDHTVSENITDLRTWPLG